MSARFRFNNHYERKMYNRKRHRRRSAEARALEEPQFRQQIIEPKEEKWSYDEYLRNHDSDDQGYDEDAQSD